MTKALIQQRGAGRTVSTSRMTVEYLATSDLTDDAIGIYLLTLAPRSPGAGPHYHEQMTEAFQIQSGTLSMMVDGAPVEVTSGDFVLVRPHTVHAFANKADEPVVFTLTFTPALAREGFFERMEALSNADRMDDEDAMLALMAQFDQVPVDGIGGWSD